MKQMNEAFQIGDRVLFDTDGLELAGTVIGVVTWHELFEPRTTYKVLGILNGMIIEAHAGQLQRMQ